MVKEAIVERQRIVAHIKNTATKLLVDAMERNQYKLETAEIIASAMEEIAAWIEEGAHWDETK